MCVKPFVQADSNNMSNLWLQTHCAGHQRMIYHTRARNMGHVSRSLHHYANLKIHIHDDVIKWKHFPRYWPFVRGIHRSPVNSSHKGQWRGALMFSLICTRINGWVNNREAGDLRRHRACHDVTVMYLQITKSRRLLLTSIRFDGGRGGINPHKDCVKSSVVAFYTN